MDISQLTDKEALLVLSALDYFLVENYDKETLNKHQFNLIEAKLINTYNMSNKNGREKVREMQQDMDKIRKDMIKKLL